MTDIFHKTLYDCIPEDRIKENENMALHTSFKTGGYAKYFISPETDEELTTVINIAKEHAREFFVVGNCSNLLVSDSGIDTVISTRKISKINLDDSNSVLNVEAGILLSEIAEYSLKKLLSGLEFASGIPGTLGGAVYMNAGAYESEIKDILIDAKLISDDGFITLSNKELEFGYRHSLLQDKDLTLVSARLKLNCGNFDEISSKMRHLNLLRREKQPLEYPSAGSTFKRPKNNYAGKLIMDSGLSGHSIGGAKVSEKHCGFIINIGSASSMDIFLLIEHVKNTVFEKFNIALTPELKMIGKF